MNNEQNINNELANRLRATRLIHNGTQRLELDQAWHGQTAQRSSLWLISLLHYLSYALFFGAVMWFGFINGLCFSWGILKMCSYLFSVYRVCFNVVSRGNSKPQPFKRMAISFCQTIWCSLSQLMKIKKKVKIKRESEKKQVRWLMVSQSGHTG